MKNRRCFLERMSEIDDELLLRAENSAVVKNKGNSYKKWAILAAALVVVCAISLTVGFFYINEKNQNINDTEDILQVPIFDVYWVDNRARNNKNIAFNESAAIIFPWSELEVYEKYTSMLMNEEKYSARSSYYGGEVLANQIGKKLADAECSGYDIYEDKSYKIACEAFEIIGVDSNRIVAVKYHDYEGYYAFIKDEHQAPETLGELIDALNLTENIKLNSFYYDSYDNEIYALSNEKSAELWNIIKKYANAPICSDEAYRDSYSSNTKISFSLNSNTLGVYNLSFAFTESGYLRTNIENYGYIYNIGKDAVDEIVDFALKNRLLILLPEKQYLTGTVTEVGEDYIKVDDSIMMKNTDDGIEFTVYTNSRNKLKWLIEIKRFKVGDTVRIEHSYLLKDSYTKIENAVSIDKCQITSDGQIIIAE